MWKVLPAGKFCLTRLARSAQVDTPEFRAFPIISAPQRPLGKIDPSGHDPGAANGMLFFYFHSRNKTVDRSCKSPKQRKKMPVAVTEKSAGFPRPALVSIVPRYAHQRRNVSDRNIQERITAVRRC